ncbi:MAG: hypothetical protein IMHGJWDQ_001576 [Candidatus Fervidibacter sp.]
MMERVRLFELFSILLGVLIILVGLGVWGGISAQRWEYTRQRQARDLLQKGWQFHRQWTLVGTIRWSLRTPNGGWVEQVGEIIQTGTGLAVRSDGRELLCAFSGCQVARTDMPVKVAPLGQRRYRPDLDRWALLLRNYAIRSEGITRIGDRLYRAIKLVPHHPTAYARRLLLDPETGMVVGQAVLDKDGTPLSMWEWLKVKEKVPNRFTLPRTDAIGVAPKTLFKALPQGFVAEGEVESRCKCCDCGMTAQLIHCTDGVTEISVYLLDEAHKHRGCPYCHIPAEPKERQLGALAVVVVPKPHPVAVVGEVPLETARKLAQAMASAP